ncbi:MAG TPA: hypothetical protein VK607_18860 [Kofleriaceae bacterium]|nr:hypothetical protein [Kofleriaceae bacterium]
MTDDRNPTRPPPSRTARPGDASDPADPADPADAGDAGDPLPANASDVLAGWATSEVPIGFVDRVVVATHGGRAALPPRRARRSIVAAAAATVALLAVATATDVIAPRYIVNELPSDGARVVQARESIALGTRGVAVAEAGAELTWSVSAAGAAEVHQTRGDVFYRVEPGGPFAVATPYGRIEVRGTCFRVEVLNMSVARQSWIGGAVGAALAATIVIAVYEGRVRVVNARGHADAGPGERIALGAGAAPSRLPPGPSALLAAVEPPPPASASPADLLQRDQSHRGEIALLRARLRALETTAAAVAAAPDARAAAPGRRDGSFKIVDLSQEELAEMATRCEIRFDIPGYGLEPRTMTDKLAQAEQLSSSDRAVYDRAVRKESERYMTALRALHRELTGGDGGDALDAHALMIEIIQKSPHSDAIEARRRLSGERAGLAAPPADTQGQTVVERLFRLQSAAGDTLERVLATELGPEKAHQIREAGWAGSDTSVIHSCED